MTTALNRDNPILSMFSSADAMVSVERKDLVIACLNGLSQHANFRDMVAETSAASDDGFWPEPDSWRAALRPYVVKDGILHIPVKGVLLNEFPWAVGSWATGYEYIQRAFERGVRDFKDGNIKGIALVENSPGGTVAGCWDAVDRMVALKAESGVPVRAFAHESAYSAAYGIATVADQIVVSRTGGVGSIGTVRTHIDWSKWNEQAGLTYTFIQAGEFKTDGHPDKPLSASARKRWEQQVTELNEIFVAAVARGRDLDPQTIRDFEAATFSASQALSNGLADSIGTLDDALVAYAADLSSDEGDVQMSTQDTAAETQAAITAAREEGRQAGISEGSTAAVTRINAILASDAGKARPKAALSAALKTNMTADEAIAFLSDLAEETIEAPTAPAATAAEPTDPVAESMDLTGGGPAVGANAAADEPEAKDDGSDIVALVRSAGIGGFTPAPKN